VSGAQEAPRALVMSVDAGWCAAMVVALEERGYEAWKVPSAGPMLMEVVRERYQLLVLDARRDVALVQSLLEELRLPPWGPPCLLHLPDRFRVESRGRGLDLATSAQDDLSQAGLVLREAELVWKQLATLAGTDAATPREA
jgi:hypothetical protein